MRYAWLYAYLQFHCAYISLVFNTIYAVKRLHYAFPIYSLKSLSATSPACVYSNLLILCKSPQQCLYIIVCYPLLSEVSSRAGCPIAINCIAIYATR